jgi:hypothetical protein
MPIDPPVLRAALIRAERRADGDQAAGLHLAGQASDEGHHQRGDDAASMFWMVACAAATCACACSGAMR